MKRASLTKFLLFACTLALLIVPGAASAQSSTDYKIVGYFTQWGMYARQYRVKNIITDGSAPKLTHILYAFANVATDYECYEESRLGWGDQSADYQVGYSADQSVDGIPDGDPQPIKGHWNQLKKLKVLYPDLKVLIAIGGYTWSGRFSGAALPENREKFVKSCIDLFIKGNLPIWAHGTKGPDIAGASNNGRAAGVFDGIDIDWEYPALPGFEGDPKRNIPPNEYRPEDTQNFTALIAEFRKQLDELGKETGKHYLLTIAAPAGKDQYSKFELEKLHPYLDWINLMAYDLHGAWDKDGPTNFHAALYNSPDDPTEAPYNLSVDNVVTTYLDKGIPPEKLVLGVPFYGRGWTNVPDRNNGLYQSDPGMEPAPGKWEAGIEDYKVLKELGSPIFRDPKTKALWTFDGSTFWSYDDPQVMTEKMALIKQKKLGGAMFWSIDGDDGSLVSAIYDGLKK